METVFDHNPTKEELLTLFGYDVDRDKYLSLPSDQQSEYGVLYRLFSLRNDSATAEKYLNLIIDPLFRHSLSTSDLLQ
jgi:hypothetical protein